MRKENLKFITFRMSIKIARLYSARTYLKYFSLTGEGVNNIFKAAIRATLLIINRE